MASRSVDKTGSRLLETGMVKWRWLMPWACRGCRRFGAVEVRVEMANRSTNDEIIEKIERDHRALSTTCPVDRRDRVVGRVYRWKGGQKIYLRKKDERVDEVKEQKWPPWSE